MSVEAKRPPPGTLRVFLPAVLTWALTAWNITQPGQANFTLIIAASLGAGLVGLVSIPLFRRTPKLQKFARTALSLGAIAIVAVVLLSARTSQLEHLRHHPLLATAAEHNKLVTVDVRLAAFPKHSATASGEKAWVRATTSHPIADVSVLIWLPDPETVPQHWAPGTALQIVGELQPSSPADSAAYTLTPVQLSEPTDQPVQQSLGTVAAAVRHDLSQRASAVVGAELVPGFAVGDTSLVTESLQEAMLESSLTHLTAVSGSNTGLVVASVIAVLSRLGMCRKSRILFAALALSGFVIVVGPDASVQRAAIMAAVLLVSGFGGKHSSALPALGAAVMILLMRDPWQALQPGFALSVAATTGILLWATPLTKWLTRTCRLPHWLCLPVAIAIAAQLSCGPLLLLLQPGIPAIGLIANVLAAPAAPIGTLLGMLAALVGPWNDWLADTFVVLASWPARWVAATAVVTSDLPFGRWNWPAGWSGAWLLAACQLALLFAWTLHKGHVTLPAIRAAPVRQPWQATVPRPTAHQLITKVLVAAALATFCVFTVITPATEHLSTPKNWVVVACDVGQGDALLLRDPDDPDVVMLVDTGDDPNLLQNCLTRFSVTRISLLVLTHDDRDHVGALSSVVDLVDEALIAPLPRGESPTNREVTRLLSAARVPFGIGATGMSTPTPNAKMQWRVLAPQRAHTATESNETSLVMRVTAGNAEVLLLGDTGHEEQAELLRSGELLQADVLKVSHHGSRDHDPALTQQVGASWGLISVGADNTYGHPSTDALGSLARAGTVSLRTDQHGSVALLSAAGGQLTPWVERP